MPISDRQKEIRFPIIRPGQPGRRGGHWDVVEQLAFLPVAVAHR